VWVGDGRSSSNSGCFPALQRVTEMVEHTWEQWVLILGRSEYSYLGEVSRVLIILGRSESSTHHTWE